MHRNRRALLAADVDGPPASVLAMRVR